MKKFLILIFLSASASATGFAQENNSDDDYGGDSREPASWQEAQRGGSQIQNSGHCKSTEQFEKIANQVRNNGAAGRGADRDQAIRNGCICDSNPKSPSCNRELFRKTIG